MEHWLYFEQVYEILHSNGCVCLVFNKQSTNFIGNLAKISFQVKCNSPDSNLHFFQGRLTVKRYDGTMESVSGATCFSDQNSEQDSARIINQLCCQLFLPKEISDIFYSDANVNFLVE